MFPTRRASIRAIAFLAAIVFSLTIFVTSFAEAKGRGGSVHVRGYYRNNGTYVQPYYRSAPDGYFWNNWSTVGNVNPYTGEPGTKAYPSPSYGHFEISPSPQVQPETPVGPEIIAPLPTWIGGNPSSRSPPVYVRGFYRKNGKYVPPHYRSAPDHHSNNNWSTVGNINPYTGKLGTKESSAPAFDHSGTTPVRSLPDQEPPEIPPLPSWIEGNPGSASNVPSDIPDTDRQGRISAANELGRLGLNVDWSKHSWLEMNDWASRIRQARELTLLGLNVDWREHTWLEMNDWASRIRQAGELGLIGVNVDWHEHTWLEMNDWATRIRQAGELGRVGLNVDWREHTWLEMNDWASRIRESNSLRQLGIHAEWREHSLLELMSMEIAARAR